MAREGGGTADGVRSPGVFRAQHRAVQLGIHHGSPAGLSPEKQVVEAAPHRLGGDENIPPDRWAAATPPGQAISSCHFLSRRICNHTKARSSQNLTPDRKKCCGKTHQALTAVDHWTRVSKLAASAKKPPRSSGQPRACAELAEGRLSPHKLIATFRPNRLRC